MTWCIIDIETNGLSKLKGRITEIAIYKHDGKKVIEEFVSLINPESPIPYDISRLTGITNQMVQDAPKFYEVAKSIIEITEGSVFVAHNVNFDYGFVQEEFRRLGYTFKRDKLCTVKQSRALIPGHASYSLGRITRDLGIIIDGRHRAAGDAKATVKLFEILHGIDATFGTKAKPEEQLSKYLHPALDVKKVLAIPKDTGVYYLYNEKGEIIYIGKSVNLRTRLFNHLRQPKTNKAMRMHAEVADLSYEITGSELIALLKESEEIKKLQPKYNVAQKRPNFNFGIVKTEDLFGYIHLAAIKINQSHQPISRHSTLGEAKSFLESLCKEYQLCLGLAGLSKCTRGCVYYGVKDCQGAAICEENADAYNLRVREAIERIQFINKDCLLIEKGSDSDKQHAILLENGKYIGYGEFDPEFVKHPDAIIDCIHTKMDNPDVRGIISSFLRTGKIKRIVDLQKLQENR
ncbi:MAG: GIY-YIG nuclease family protein [Flavobacteriales bacterium]|nr:GIY-YIG nuclease family protein [Flavobacteriales bacterium]